MAKFSQTPLTVETFFEAIMPRIEEVIEEKIDSKFDEKFDDYTKDVVGVEQSLRGLRKEVKTFSELTKGYRSEIQVYRNEVVDFKAETMGEIKALREEIEVLLHQYKRSDRRLDRIEKKLKFAPLNF